MAHASRSFDASPAEVFAVLTDPSTYPDWLIGADHIRDVDDAWPAPGSRFHHRVGVGPVKLEDSTEVVDIEPDELLRLSVRARPLVSAVATFEVVGSARRCTVSLQEEPSIRIIGGLVRPVLDPLTHVRNHRSLRRLAHVVDARVKR